MYKDKEVQNVKNFFVNVWRKNIFDIYVTRNGGLNQILRRQTSRSHYGSQVPVVTVTVFKYRNKIVKRFALFDLLKSLFSDTIILSKYIPSLQKKS
jgi:hypothetical protein